MVATSEKQIPTARVNFTNVNKHSGSHGHTVDAGSAAAIPY